MERPDYWYQSDFLSDEFASSTLLALIEQVNWRQEKIKMFGKTINMPRLQVFMGNTDLQYSYSNLTMQAEPWHPAIVDIRDKIEALTGEHFNSALVNYYRHGQDSMGWHQDNEKELGNNPIIASISLGETRRFLLRHIKTQEKHELLLSNGSLLWMGPTLQSQWKHSLPKSKAPLNPRINITFRQIKR